MHRIYAINKLLALRHNYPVFNRISEEGSFKSAVAHGDSVSRRWIRVRVGREDVFNSSASVFCFYLYG